MRLYDRDDTRSPPRPFRVPDHAGDPVDVAGRAAPVFHGTGLEPRPRAGGRRGAVARRAHRRRGAARDGIGRRARLRPLPRRPEPGAVGCARRGAPAARASRRRAVAGRRGDHRHRRHDRTAMGAEDRGAGHLSRSRPLVEGTLRQDQRPALARAGRHAPGALRGPALGTALPHRAGPLGALEPGASPTPQDPDRLGSPGHPAEQALAREPPRHRGGRQQLRRPRPHRRPAPPRHPDHAAAPRRQPVRTRPRARSRPTRPPRPEGKAGAQARCRAARPRHRLDEGDADRMVRRRDLPARIRLGDGALAQGRPAAPADPLGAGARPHRHPRRPGVPVHRCRPRRRGDPHALRHPLAHRDHVPGGPPAPRRRDPAPVVRQGHPAHHTRPARPLLPRHALGARVAHPAGPIRPRTAAWYDKRLPTFSDALADVRRALWWPQISSTSPPSRDPVEIHPDLLHRWIDTLCRAA